jgi:hypothetical protein
VVHPPPVGGLAQPGKELVDCHIERRVPVVGRGLGPNDRATRVNSELNPLGAIGQPPIVLLGDLHLDPDHPGGEPLQACQLVFDVPTETIGHLTVPTLDHNVHESLPVVELSAPVARDP